MAKCIMLYISIMEQLSRVLVSIGGKGKCHSAEWEIVVRGLPGEAKTKEKKRRTDGKDRVRKSWVPKWTRRELCVCVGRYSRAVMLTVIKHLADDGGECHRHTRGEGERGLSRRQPSFQFHQLSSLSCKERPASQSYCLSNLICSDLSKGRLSMPAHILGKYLDDSGALKIKFAYSTPSPSPSVPRESNRLCGSVGL